MRPTQILSPCLRLSRRPLCSFTGTYKERRKERQAKKAVRSLKQYKQPGRIVEEFSQKVEGFAREYDRLAEIAERGELMHSVMFARNCLIANRVIPLEKSFPLLKMSLSDPKKTLTPFLCAAGMECLHYHKFEGDENKLLQRLCSYYESNFHLFNRNEEVIFWTYYVLAMTEKTRQTVKFIKVDRRDQQVLQKSNMKSIGTQLISSLKINPRIVTHIDYQNENALNLVLRKPGAAGKEFQLRIKPIVDVNKLKVHSKAQYESYERQQYIIKYIMEMNADLKKGWHCMFVGKLPKQAPGRERYEQTTVDKQTGLPLGYVKTEKILEEVKVNQEVLNDTGSRLDLRLTNRFHQGIFYNDSNPRTRVIDMITTILLAADSKALAKGSLHFIEKGNSHDGGKIIADYLSIPQLMECYGSARILEQHWSLFNEYLHYHKLINMADKRKFEEEFGITQIRQQYKNQEITKSEAEYLLNDPEKMVEINKQLKNQTLNLELNQQYNLDFSSVYETKGSVTDQAYWQMNPLFPETLKMIARAEQILQQGQGLGKTPRITVYAEKQYVPHLVRNIIEAKYWTVPVSSMPQQAQQKQDLLSFLLQPRD